MSNIINRKTYIISVNLITLTGAVTSQVTLPPDLTFAADELVVKSLAYSSLAGNADFNDLVQIACNITNDNLICAFPNTLMFSKVHDEHFAFNNSFFWWKFNTALSRNRWTNNRRTTSASFCISCIFSTTKINFCSSTSTHKRDSSFDY